MNIKKVLYISYDGMTDPLGQSQVIPYVQGLSALGYKFTILSFEKADRLANEGEAIKSCLDAHGISWSWLSFTRRPPLLSKVYDASRMRSRALALHGKHHYDVIHCRSYVAAAVGVRIKRETGARFIFDMRGFWPDEKKDGGSWDQERFVYRQIYRYYKRREADYLGAADSIICLTEAGRREMAAWPSMRNAAPVTVIPCCSDMDLFSVTDKGQRQSARRKLQIPDGILVLSYLGSLGAWYMLDEMLRFFSVVKTIYPTALFLFVTNSDEKLILERLPHHKLSAVDVQIRQCGRCDVPGLIKASDVNISFIKPVYSKISSSPTKLGEVLSMGIPVVSNSGVGDVAEIVTRCGAGVLIENFTEAEFRAAAERLAEVITTDPSELRNAAAQWFDLKKGIELYRNVYVNLEALQT